MTFHELAMSYYRKALSRRKILPVLLEDRNFSDVIRESQEIVELALKGILRELGVDPPRHHDVGPALLEARTRIAGVSKNDVDRMASISLRLRKERELAFYGDVDFIPTEKYSLEDAEAAIAEVDEVIRFMMGIITEK